jgi:DNA-binding phage protein
MTTERFSRYDTAAHLKSEDDIEAYLEAVMENGDPALIAAGAMVISCVQESR